MGQINVEPGMLIYSTLQPHELRPGDGNLTLIIGEYPGREGMDQTNIDRCSDTDLQNLRKRLVNALTCVENAMEDRGYFKRYTTESQD